MKPSEMPEGVPLVAVKDWQFSPGSHFPQVTAHHAFIDVRDAEGQCWRFEVQNAFTKEVLTTISEAEISEDERQTRPINLRTLISGPKALRVFERLKANAKRFEARMVTKDELRPMVYRAWPGPNSNTFVAWMLRETDELSATLPHASYGRDFDLTLLVGPSDAEDGFELETAFIGAEIGFSKGIELHLGQTTFGVALFPPAIKIPGFHALGFAPAQRIDRSEEYEFAKESPKNNEAKAK